MSFFTEYYLHIKVLHIIAVVAWFAGLFYIFRLFVYHAQKREVAEVCATLSVMEAKLLRIIMLPASVVVAASGTLLAVTLPGTFVSTWFWAKICGVFALFLYQWVAFRTHDRFKKGDIYLTEKQCRLINEVPTLLLFWIVTLVVLKPWL